MAMEVALDTEVQIEAEVMSSETNYNLHHENIIVVLNMLLNFTYI